MSKAPRERARPNMRWTDIQNYPADTDFEWCYSHMGQIPRGAAVHVMQQGTAPATTFCAGCAALTKPTSTSE